MTQIITSPRIWLLGLASWLVPFAFSFLFHDQSGQLLIAEPLFKSIMVVVGGAFGAWLLLRAFRAAAPSLATGLIIGLIWLGLNIGLDLIVLVGVFGMDLKLYFISIGLRYLLIPVIGAAMGQAVQQASEPADGSSVG